jgi:hypothetical protein
MRDLVAPDDVGASVAGLPGRAPRTVEPATETARRLRGPRALQLGDPVSDMLEHEVGVQ